MAPWLFYSSKRARKVKFARNPHIDGCDNIVRLFANAYFDWSKLIDRDVCSNSKKTLSARIGSSFSLFRIFLSFTRGFDHWWLSLCFLLKRVQVL
jgi:hypothetical protein